MRVAPTPGGAGGGAGVSAGGGWRGGWRRGSLLLFVEAFEEEAVYGVVVSQFGVERAANLVVVLHCNGLVVKHDEGLNFGRKRSYAGCTDAYQRDFLRVCRQ